MKLFNDGSNSEELKKCKREASRNKLSFDAQTALWQMLGVNLLDIPGINSKTALTIVSEIGPSVNHFRSAKQFTSWLGLAPNNKKSGGKRLSGRTPNTANRIKHALRMATLTLERTNKALGAFSGG